MAYVKQTWVDRPSKTTPINAKRLNHMEEGIYEASQSSQSSTLQNAGSHNVFRGKDLGTSFTDSQSAQIVAGTFDDLFVGDYWTINEKVYRIAGFDIYLGMGVEKVTSHHAVIVPDKSMYSAAMNDTDSTSTGYLNSKMKTENLSQALTTVRTDFGESHVISRNARLVKSAVDGVPTDGEFVNSYIDLMNEHQLFGSRVCEKVGSNDSMRGGIDSVQFPLFLFAPNLINDGIGYWTSSMWDGNYYIEIWNNGLVTYTNNTIAQGVRPFFLIA